MPNIDLKYVAAIVLYGMWFALVLMGKADINMFVMGIVSALTGLGVFKATLTNPNSNPKDLG